MEEKELLSKIANSNENAFETVFRAYYAQLCTYANSLLKDTSESEEVVQGIFIAFWEGRRTFDIHTSLKSYLYRAVHNTCLNRLKHFKVRQVYKDEYIHQNSEEACITEDMLGGSELSQQIAKAIEKLPPQCQTVFKLSRQQGLSYAEIAEQLEVSVKAVDKQIVRALRILREELRDYLPAILIFILFKN